MASESKKLIEKLDTYFEDGAKADSGGEPRKWFDEEDFEDTIREALTEVDRVAKESYQDSESDDEFESSQSQIIKRQELMFAQAMLSGYRMRYVAGNDSMPRSELDSRRYSMYSAEARRVVLDELKDLFR